MTAAEEEEFFKVPFDSTEVTEEWMCRTLLSSLSTSSPSSAKRTWLYVAAMQESGMLSSIFRARLDVTFEDGSAQEHKIFLKIMPPDDIHKFLINNSFMDVTEIESYRTLFPDLDRFEKEQRQGQGTGSGSGSGSGLVHQGSDNNRWEGILSVFPHMYAGGYVREPPERRSFFVMLEDLDPEYRMLDFEAGLTKDQLVASLRDLARFHATCYAYGQVKKIDFRKKYGSFLSTFFANFEDDKELEDFMEDNMDLVERDMAGSQVEHLMLQVRNLRKDIGKKYKAAIKCDGYERFIMHGDIWANNVLFGGAGGDRTKILDWQFTSTGSIFLDFGTLAWISMPPGKTSEHADDLISAYHDVFGRACQELGCSSLPWRDREEFSDRARAEGMYLAFLWCSTSYELVEKYPALKERVHWVLEQSVRLTPHLYQ